VEIIKRQLECHAECLEALERAIGALISDNIQLRQDLDRANRLNQNRYLEHGGLSPEAILDCLRADLE
jgi:hypothetical protein